MKWEAEGYSSFLVEEYIAHENHDEHYLSFERVREGIRVLWTHVVERVNQAFLPPGAAL